MIRDSYCEGVHDGIAQLLVAGNGIVLARQDLRAALSRAVEAGALRRLLPATYCLPGLADDLVTRARALMAHDPHAVVVGRAAAALTWWPELKVPVLAARRPGHPLAVRGYQWTKCAIPAEHVVEAHGIRLLTPAASVLDLIPSLGGDVIDEALRRRAATLDELWAALAETPRRRGNTVRAQLLHDSRDEPWSEAERLLHRIVRGLALPWPYRTNHPVPLDVGGAFVDLALPALKLGFEVDGYAHHSSRTAFTRDRVRDLGLSLAGWSLHRIPATTVDDEPAMVGEAVSALARRRADELGLRPPVRPTARRAA